MPIQKQPITVNFNQGLETKVDPNQVPVGKFERLVNTSFNRTGLLSKRNGAKALSAISGDTPTSLTTYSGGLAALGNSLSAYSQDTGVWTKQGDFTPVQLSVLTAYRSSTSQSSVDVAVASNGLACVTFVDSTLGPRYQIIDSVTGQVVVPAVSLPTGSALPRVFANGNNFVVTFLVTISSAVHLQYIAIPISTPSSPLSATDISTQVKTIGSAYDGFVAAGLIYLAWQGSDTGGAIRATSIDSNLNLHTVIPIAGYNPTVIAVSCDTTQGSPLVWLTFLDSITGNTFAGVYSSSFGTVKAPFQVLTGQAVVRLTSVAGSGGCSAYYELSGTYSYGVQAYQGGTYSNVTGVANNSVSVALMSQTGGVSTQVVKLGAGLASKAFWMSGKTYVLCAYQSTYQSSYFLINQNGLCVARIAYENGGGYPTNTTLSGVNVSGNKVTFAYLFKDFITSLSPGANQSPVGGIYTQTGVNLAQVTIGDVTTQGAEIGGSLHLTGGQLWMYDGAVAVEHGFHLWPDNIGYTTTTTGGSLAAQRYFYQVCYEWTDGQGMLHRSAPSVPVSVDLSSAGTSTSTVTLSIPTLKMTAKSSVRIVIYRWSTANQSYYQITSVSSPTLNDPTVSFITYADTQADSAIQGNALIYTAGSVVENIAAPACNIITLYKSRLFAVDAEDSNTIWFSKQVIAGVPVEMSDLLTIYVAPTSGAQGSTGGINALSAMDDKLVVFKRDAIYYITGTGPDNTGANNDFSDPVFITSSVGCSNPSSIVLMPNGLMFQSDKGIWLLGRDLSTTYIGAPVEAFNSKNVLSAINVPGTNEVRFTLDSGELLVFDYFSNQWGSYEGAPAIGATIYQGLHTYLNAYGQVYQETPGVYLDGARPVTMSFTTGWITLTGLQGYQRLYEILLLGEYKSPHKLQIGIAYNYAPAVQQVINIQPTNSAAPYGSDAVYGSSATYSQTASEKWRLFPAKQKCEAIQITLTETYDPSLGQAAGAGLTISGLTFIIGAKKGYSPRSAAQTAG